MGDFILARTLRYSTCAGVLSLVLAMAAPAPPVNSEDALRRLGAELIFQGAEAKVYSASFLGRPAIVKYRFPKTYRHPTLNERLTARRLVQEGRAMGRCRKAGIPAPLVYAVDTRNDMLIMERIEGFTAKACIDSDSAPFSDRTVALASKIGALLSAMHEVDLIHGDLTTSNLFVRPIGGAADAVGAVTGDYQVVPIDFGLSTQSNMVEDKAVDLYVLERAFVSSHEHSEELFSVVLKEYAKRSKGSRVVIKKLGEVRMRGRKKLAFG